MSQNASRFVWEDGQITVVKKAKPVQSIAKYDPAQPRGAKGTHEGGQFIKAGARQFTSEEGYEWHEKGPVRDWALALPYKVAKELSGYASFGYHDVNDLRRGTYKTPITAHDVRPSSKEEFEATAVFDEQGQRQITDEYIKQHGHPFHKGYDVRKISPDDPYHRVLDEQGNYVGHVNPNYGNYVVQRAGPDTERLAEVTRQADALDSAIRDHGYELPEDMVVQRGAYYPGVTFEQLQDMQYEGPNGEPPAVWEEKGFTSTFVGDAGGRARFYPLLGKNESIHNRFPDDSIYDHQSEVGTAVRFYITLPKGTKVASIESARRLEHEFPRKPDPSPRPPDIEPEYWTMRDYDATPKVTFPTEEHDKHHRTESELLLGSGARFRVVKVKRGETVHSDDPRTKPVENVEVYLEYIGGGSSQGVRR